MSYHRGLGLGTSPSLATFNFNAARVPVLARSRTRFRFYPQHSRGSADGGGTMRDRPGMQSYRENQPIPGTPYLFVKKLGEGAQGEVYVALDPRLERPVVLKLLNPTNGARARSREQIEKEAKALAQFDHPNIVQVRNVDFTAEATPRPYIVMPLLKGDTLAAILRRRRFLPTRDAVILAAQMLDGLDEAHTHPTHAMVHRDIKPANVFVQLVSPHESRAVLLDFGIAELIDVTRRTGQFFYGTIRYAAPEQYRGKAYPQSDIYAVGCVLFEMITGNHVFRGTQGEVEEQHRFATAPSVSQWVKVPKALELLIAQALEKDHTKRPASAFAFKRALRALDQIIQLEELADRSAANTTDEMPIEQLLSAIGEPPNDDEPASVDDLLNGLAVKRPERVVPGITTTEPGGPPVIAQTAPIGDAPQFYAAPTALSQASGPQQLPITAPPPPSEKPHPRRRTDTEEGRVEPPKALRVNTYRMIDTAQSRIETPSPAPARSRAQDVVVVEPPRDWRDTAQRNARERTTSAPVTTGELAPAWLKHPIPLSAVKPLVALLVLSVCVLGLALLWVKRDVSGARAPVSASTATFAKATPLQSPADVAPAATASSVVSVAPSTLEPVASVPTAPAASLPLKAAPLPARAPAPSKLGGPVAVATDRPTPSAPPLAASAAPTVPKDYDALRKQLSLPPGVIRENP